MNAKFEHPPGHAPSPHIGIVANKDLFLLCHGSSSHGDAAGAMLIVVLVLVAKTKNDLDGSFVQYKNRKETAIETISLLAEASLFLPTTPCITRHTTA